MKKKALFFGVLVLAFVLFIPASISAQSSVAKTYWVFDISGREGLNLGIRTFSVLAFDESDEFTFVWYRIDYGTTNSARQAIANAGYQHNTPFMNGSGTYTQSGEAITTNRFGGSIDNYTFRDGKLFHSSGGEFIKVTSLDATTWPASMLKI